jgi:hypothetical protein
MSNIVKKNLLNELMTKQLKNITPSKRLRYKDLSRIVKHLDSSIFADEKCSFWTGYITNINNTKKGIYINFYFKQKKVALHRLLYANFVGSINDNEYLKFSCEHRGKCCNVNHLVKYTKVSVDDDNIKETNTSDVVDSSIFTITFD